MDKWGCLPEKGEGRIARSCPFPCPAAAEVNLRRCGPSRKGVGSLWAGGVVVRFANGLALADALETKKGFERFAETFAWKIAA